MELISKKWLDVSRDISPAKYELEKLAKYSDKKLKKKLKKYHYKPNGVLMLSRKDYFNMGDYFNSPERYFNDLMYMIESLQEILTDETRRDVYVKFRLVYDTKIYKMSLIHFIFNMLMWLPLIALGVDIEKKHFFNPVHFDNDEYIKFMNSIIRDYKDRTTHNELSQLLSIVFDTFIYICEKYSLIFGMSISMYDLLSIWDNEELKELSNVKIPEDMQIAECEQFLRKVASTYQDIIMDEMQDTVLVPLIRSGQFKRKQFTEFLINIGQKPDFRDNTIPYKPSPGTNLTANGIRELCDFAMDAFGGRLAAILSLAIGTSGYFARTFIKSVSDIHLCLDPNYDCGSTHYYECKMNEKELRRMNGRYYLAEDEHGHQVLRELTSNDYDVIGKTLKFRTPATCAGGDKGICHICYGHLYNQNMNIAAGVLAALKSSERYYQNTMSVKHILETKTNKIEFCPAFDKLFSLEHLVQINLRDDIDDIENYVLMINVNTICRDKDYDDIEHNEYIKEINIKNTDTNEDIKIYDENDNLLYFSNQLYHIIYKKRKNNKHDEDGWMTIPLSKLDPALPVFFIKLSNAGITKPLRELRGMIEKGEVVEADTYSELINKVKYLMECGQIEVDSVHIEVICRNLIRDAHDIINIPDYSKDEIEYTVTSIHGSIKHSNSVNNGLTFEKLDEQFRSPSTYRKTGTSVYDVLFELEHK